ncbi:collagenase-like protease [Paenibacillus sp. CAA11]|uniref:peptidase U32 family protein n=1 Tax=Paenibacillus sp. CAA11 TaxID=1532905 RepID=UPI000D3753A9|nr:peptidase U32 family protein [Paenibacillus sp. CAA11]AWB45665.1 collagenase-like protease [Paenibacillus sp. CAA11]
MEGYKPELIAPAGSLAEVEAYISAGATAVLIGEDLYGMRLPGELKGDELVQAVNIAHNQGVKVVVSVNNLMSNELLKGLPAYLRSLEEAGVDAIEFGDPAVLSIAKEDAPSLKLHWNAEMTSTNYATANYWGRKGASRVVLARELNMDEIVGMMPHLEIEAQAQIHGMTNIYHSKRRLVASYMLHQGRPVEGEDLGLHRGLFLIEEERKEEKFPIYEDINGTHIMSSDDICIIEDLHLMLEAGVQSFKIETLLKPAAYNVAAIKAYRQAMDSYVEAPEAYQYDEAWLEEVRRLQDPERELSFGFFYKEQVF